MDNLALFRKQTLICHKYCTLSSGTLNLQATTDKLIYFSRYPQRPNVKRRGANVWSWAGITVEKGSRTKDLDISNVVINGSYSGLRIHRDGIVKVHNCYFANNNWGLQLRSKKANVIVIDSLFHNNDNGIDFADYGMLEIRECKFTEHQTKAIAVSPGSPRQRPETVVVSDNVFSGGSNSIYLSLSNSTDLRLERNRFARTQGYIDLTVSHCKLTVQGNHFLRMGSYRGLTIWPVHSHVVIRNNTWKYCGQSLLLAESKDSEVTIEKNVFHATYSRIYDTIFVEYEGNSTVKIRSNAFTKNRVMKVIAMSRMINNATPLEIHSNLFSMNSVHLSVIHSYEPCEIHNNTFDNPNSTHDFAVGDFSYQGIWFEAYGAVRGVTNATFNWWGVATRSGIAERIRIGVPKNSWKPGRHSVKFEPFLKRPPPLPSCSKVASCSHHGECVLPDTCVCHPGWAGAACDRCDENYLGPRCRAPTVLEESFYRKYIAESASVGKTLLTVKAKRPDNITVVYTITAGNGDRLFGIHRESGKQRNHDNINKRTAVWLRYNQNYRATPPQVFLLPAMLITVKSVIYITTTA